MPQPPPKKSQMQSQSQTQRQRQSLLSHLRARTAVDCDLLSAATAAKYGPFEDCTSNQAIAFAELPLPVHAELVRRAVRLARALHSEGKYENVGREALGVEICMLALQIEVSPHLKGCVHIQANPFDAFSTARTVEGVRRIVALCRVLLSEADSRTVPADLSERICIKIPSTWEGLQACRILEKEGIFALATTLFTIEQAALAGEVGCRYVAPYVHELRAQTEDGHQDPSPLRSLPPAAQRYYEKHDMRTQVLPASLKTVEECMAFAGVRHITIAPALLEELAGTEVDAEDVPGKYPSLFDDKEELEREVPPRMRFLEDEEGFRMAVLRRDGGEGARKLVQALNIFCDMQVKLEEFVRPFFSEEGV